MRQQTESMKETRKEYSNELFNKGWQEGYTACYKKGIDDIAINFLDSVGKLVFNETSIERLTKAREGFRPALNTSHHYEARVYIALIDARLEELSQRQKYAPEKPITSTPITPSSGRTKIFTWTFGNIRSGPGHNYPVITTVRKGDITGSMK